MSAFEKYLKPYGLFQDQSYDEFCAKISEFFLRKNVPEDVAQNFEVITHLLAHSYYEYRFIDEAYAKALHTFEMAMRPA